MWQHTHTLKIQNSTSILFINNGRNGSELRICEEKLRETFGREFLVGEKQVDWADREEEEQGSRGKRETEGKLGSEA